MRTKKPMKPKAKAAKIRKLPKVEYRISRKAERRSRAIIPKVLIGQNHNNSKQNIKININLAKNHHYQIVIIT